MKTANDKGTVAELEIATAAAKLGVPVFRPLSEHSRADLVLEVAGRLLRVQCKWGRLSNTGDVIIVATGGSRLSTTGYIRSTYADHEVELLGIYCGGLDRCYAVPIAAVAGKHAIHLRVTAPRNSQRACINLAEDFAFEGAIAQLGERCHGMAEVAGSSPASSTSQDSPEPTRVGSNPFRDRLGYWMERVAAGEEVLVTFRGRPRVRLSPAKSRPNAPAPLPDRAKSPTLDPRQCLQAPELVVER